MFREKLYIDIYKNLDVELYVEGYGVLTVKHIIDNISRYRQEIRVCSLIYDDEWLSSSLSDIHRLSSLLDTHAKALNMYHLFGDGVKTSCNPIAFQGIPPIKKAKEVSDVG